MGVDSPLFLLNGAGQMLSCEGIGQKDAIFSFFAHSVGQKLVNFFHNARHFGKFEAFLGNPSINK